MSDSLRPREPQHARPPCPSPTPGVYPNPCPLSWWCHPTISSSVVPFSSCPQSSPASGSFQMSQLFASGGQSMGVSASTSVFPMFWGMLNLRCPLAIKCCWKGSWLFLSITLCSKVFNSALSPKEPQVHQWRVRLFFFWPLYFSRFSHTHTIFSLMKHFEVLLALLYALPSAFCSDLIYLIPHQDSSSVIISYVKPSLTPLSKQGSLAF